MLQGELSKEYRDILLQIIDAASWKGAAAAEVIKLKEQLNAFKEKEVG